MRRRLAGLCIGMLALAASAMGQSWMSAYDQALARTRAGDWAGARAGFKQAAAFRTEDQSAATILPGPATERRTWRNGSPYSPNFLAAYSAYRQALESKDPAQQSTLYRTAAAEFEALLAKKQYSAESFYLLNVIYTTIGDTQGRMRLEQQLNAASGQLTWKVDTEPMMPEELAYVAQMTGRDIENPGTGDPNQGVVAAPINPTDPNNPGATIPTSVGARVPTIGSKYALIIGNSESRLSFGPMAHASDDAHAVREALVMSAGYPEANVDLVLNGTAEQMNAAAKALAERVSDGATVFIFFAGAGVNLDGKDYLCGVDSESPTNSTTMLAKIELYRAFMSKGARVFSFFQAPRPIDNGRYFGMEVPMAGFIAQMQSTVPGGTVHSIVRNGKERGLYTDALVGALNELRSNRIPIQEFGWQVFYRIRRGDTGLVGGGSRQTPTLPVLTNLAADARF